MIALIQRVTRARVMVEDTEVGVIGPGLLALVAIEPGDGQPQVARLLERLLGYRIFVDVQGRMNRSLRDCGGGLLLVSQFTLAADTGRGMRPSFSTAAAPELAQHCFEQLLAAAQAAHAPVACGRFGAHMQVELVNDGPVTFLLQVTPG